MQNVNKKLYVLTLGREQCLFPNSLLSYLIAGAAGELTDLEG